ncbi:Cuticle protein 8 [Lucilia cuprina]|nr:Cuticle protein 8 [Lucilia cuprina]
MNNMRPLISIAVIVLLCGLAAAGHYHHHEGNGDSGKEVGYSVVTSHGSGGHGGGGHGAGGHGAGGHAAGDHGSDGHGSKHGYDGGHAAYGGHGSDGGHGGHDDDDGHGHYAHPKYEFDYGVKDSKTGDIKSQSETRDGHKVKGSYTLKEADGTTRHVEYSSDKKKGFTAVVHKLGEAKGADGGHGGYGGHGSHGDHGGKADSYVIVKKHEGKKH